ncbi:unnamed protein product [Owenia fusiformis]|uniref:carbonyl reductase (NADPH) n=1 Tax=Owenia fusiformis TaxID=6347 RepID=A0A8J1Y2L8_OWEFU|nr:unnamed protein product [Owenia fusiformis]
MTQRKVAVVTGSNKGIGFGIVRGLCKKFDGDVYLTARDETRGQEAVASLEKEGLKPKFHQLNIDDLASIQRLRDFLKSTYGGLDVLVNNAAIAYKAAATEPFSEQAEVSCRVNVFGVINTCNELFPLLRPHARVVHVSSFVAKMVTDKNATVKKIFGDSKLTQEGLIDLVNDFVKCAKAGNHEAKGYANTAYGMTKVAVSALTGIQQQQFNKDPREDIIVNSADPGYVNTDMSSGKGKKTIDQGAIEPLACALLPANVGAPKGETITSGTKVLPVF